MSHNTDHCTSEQLIIPTEPTLFDLRVFPKETDALKEAEQIEQGLLALGYDIKSIWETSKKVTNKKNALVIFKQLESLQPILYSQWKRAHMLQQSTSLRAAGVYFNRTNFYARALARQFTLIDTSHIDELKNTLRTLFKKEVETGVENSEAIAQAVLHAAAKRTHELAWPWVSLPTVAKQPYGRILIGVVEIPQSPYKIYITQPTFSEGEATLQHTHGINTAYSAALGNHTHINTQWTTQSEKTVFPLRAYEAVEYVNTTGVVVIPSKTIHSISRKGTTEIPPSLEEIARDKKNTLNRITSTKVGELSSLHLYKPNIVLASEFAKNNKKDPNLFQETYDMVVFNKVGLVYASDGGAWEKRMVELGPQGGHCGMCFRENIAQEPIPDEVLRSLLFDSSEIKIQLVT